MTFFSAPDGTKLAYHEVGTGDPLVCLPGGPMRDSRYLGDLGGLSAHRRLILLDLRGTGESSVPDDTASYRCDRLVDDVEALRAHLGLDQMDLLAHSAGANLAELYVARYPRRVSRLALIAPSLLGVAITVTAQDRRDAVQLRAGEAWFPTASAALARIIAGSGTAEDRNAVVPFFYGRWNAATKAHSATEASERNQEAAAAFGAPGVFEPHATRAALAMFKAPTLILAGEVDINSPPSRAADLAALFPRGTFVVQSGAGHSPWLDDSERFVSTAAAFLTDRL